MSQPGPFSTPAFIIKLYDILDDQNRPQFEHIIRWSEDGEYFIVLKPKMMEQEVLLHYFKHNHFSSFLRQLNMYEFLKARNSENHEVFSHPYFKKGNKKQLSLIKRNPIKSKNKVIKKPKQPTDLQKQMDIELVFLKQRQQKFEGQFQDIQLQNDQIMDQHRQIWTELHQSKKTLDVKIDRISLLLSYVLQQQQPDFCKIEAQQQQNDPSLSPLFRMMQSSIRNFNFPYQVSPSNQLSPLLQLRNNSDNDIHHNTQQSHFSGKQKIKKFKKINYTITSQVEGISNYHHIIHQEQCNNHPIYGVQFYLLAKQAHNQQLKILCYFQKMKQVAHSSIWIKQQMGFEKMSILFNIIEIYLSR
ncbi:hypothetical protein pb186bvf_004632 [Paramecium bursaria]